MLKKSVLFIIVWTMSLINVAFASTGKVEFDVTNFTVYTIVNDTIKGGFEINNKTAYATSDMYYSVVVVPDSMDAFNLDAVAYESEPKQFTLLPSEKKVLSFEIGPLDSLYKDDYNIVLKIMSKTSTLWSDEAIGPFRLGEEVESIISSDYDKTHFYKIDNYTEPFSGPYFDQGKSPKAYINLKSTFKDKITLTPKYTIYKRTESYLSEPLKIIYGDNITLKAKEQKTVELKLPVMDEPESYLIKVSFLNDGRKVSYDYLFRYVVNGVSAKVLGFSTYYDYMDQKLKINTMLIGPASGETLKDVGVVIGIGSDKAEIDSIVFDEKLDLTPQTTNLSFEVEIKENTKQVVSKVLLSYNGRIIASAESIVDDIKVVKQNLTDIVNTKYEKAVKNLHSLKIISGYPDGTFKPLNNITRAEFTSIALKFKNINIDAIDPNIKNNFSDVPNSHWACKAINYAYENGVISGYGNGTFKPDAKVTYSEAITIMLNVAGLKDAVSTINESWPNNYISFANELELLKDIDISNYSDFANRGDVSLLTFNTYLMK